ncbi:MAG: helix-turn-helix domain-containing protein [Candidatus Fimimonas sp.]
MDRKEIGKKIEKIRKERKMSQYQLAMDAGLSTSYIPDLEKGLKCPTVETLDSICYALNITLKDFFTEKTEDFSQDRLSSLNDKQRKLLNEFLDSLQQ